MDAVFPALSVLCVLALHHGMKIHTYERQARLETKLKGVRVGKMKVVKESNHFLWAISGWMGTCFARNAIFPNH